MAIKNKHFLFGGGIHPEDGKALTQASPVQTAPLLEQYYVILQQHIGAPPKLLVKTGDTVKKGQKLAEAGGFVSAPVHAPTSGKVKLVDWPGASGVNLPAVEIVLSIKNQLNRYNVKTIFIQGRGENSFEEHRAILDAVKKRDVDEAERLIRKHIASMRDVLKKYYELLF